MKPANSNLLICICLLHLILSTASAQVFSQEFGPVTSIACPRPLDPRPLDPMNTRQHRLRDYRRMFIHGTSPSANDLIGTWRGVNKGIVNLVGFKQFVKEIRPSGIGIAGENIRVHQVRQNRIRCIGWQPKLDRCGNLQRHDRFLILPPCGSNRFARGVIFSYRLGGNHRFALSRLLVDRVVKIDDQHLLGRAVIRTLFGPIPVAYFVLERVQ